MRSFQTPPNEMLTMPLVLVGMVGQSMAHRNIIGVNIVRPDGPALIRMIRLSEMQPGKIGRSGI